MTAERPPRLGHWLAVAAAIGLVSTGCGLLPTAGPTAHFENQTNTPMAVFVNGVWAGTYAPGTVGDVPLTGGIAPTFLITIHSPSGALLLRLDVAAAHLESVADGDVGMGGSAELPCGAVQLSIGRIHDNLPAIAFAGMPACP